MRCRHILCTAMILTNVLDDGGYLAQEHSHYILPTSIVESLKTVFQRTFKDVKRCAEGQAKRKAGPVSAWSSHIKACVNPVKLTRKEIARSQKPQANVSAKQRKTRPSPVPLRLTPKSPSPYPGV